MSSVVTALTGGGGKGMGWNASGAAVQQPATVDQANEQYQHVNQGLDQQNQFLQALQAQNGVQNQGNVFNQQQAIANGTGANPAQAMLNNTTGANVANQAALMAGQRGSGQNAGMMARQAGMQGANIQQQAAGQGAALQANQSLNALNQMGSIAGQQVQAQGNAANAYTQSAAGAQNNILNSIGAQNNANVGMVSNMNNANAGLNTQIAKSQGDLIGNMAQGIGTALMAAEGGAVPQSAVGKYFHQFAEGGKVPAMVSPGETYLDPKDVKEVAAKGKNPLEVGEKIPGTPKVKGNSYANDTVAKDLEPGGIVIPNSIMQHKDAAKKAQAFVSAVLRKQKG